MIGFGGILAEAIADVSFRLVPLERVDADEMIEELETQALLGPFRGEPAVDRDTLAATILGLSALAAAEPDILSVDVNPLIVVDGQPVAVDALVEVAGGSCMSSAEQMRALFDPRGVVVAGTSSHPGKFGFVALHNILSQGYEGQVFATNRDGGTILGIETVTSVDELPPTRPSTSSSCARRPPRTRSSWPRARGGASRPRSSPPRATARRGSRGERPSSSWSPWPSSSACSWRGRTGRASSPPRPSCARRSSPPHRHPVASAWPASRATSCRRSRTTRCRRASASAAGSAPATRRWSALPTTSSSTRTTPRPQSGSRTSRASETDARSSTGSVRSPHASRS